MSKRKRDKLLLTALNFSGGKQSSCLLWMILRGDIEIPKDFVVINADPGMENALTYKYVDYMAEICAQKGIRFERAQGRNLYNDLLNKSLKRIDNPPYWVKKPNNKVGRLIQFCTLQYKIRPMKQTIRRILNEKYSLHRFANVPGIVHQWIGFAYDEMHRVKDNTDAYIELKYPLVELQMTRKDVDEYFVKNNLPIPPRSVCNACFANGLETFKEMYHNRPDDWENAVKVDEACRDMAKYGVKYPVYVSRTVVPLRQLAEQNFELTNEQKEFLVKKTNKDKIAKKELEIHLDIIKPPKEDDDDFSCDSGYCFT